MKHGFLPMALSLIVLAACQNPQAMVREKIETQVSEAMKTASGALTEAKNRVNTVVEPIVETATDIQKRAQTVKEGIEEITAAKAKIQEALGH